MSNMLDTLRFFVVFISFCHKFPTSFSASCPANSLLKDRRLYRFMFIKTTVIGPNMCEDTCMRMKDCESFNYNLHYFECELNTAVASNNQLGTTENFLFGNKDITKLTGPCATSNCAAQEECIETSTSAYVCIIAACGVPPTIPNSEPWTWPPLQHFGNFVQYNCTAGYVMVGTALSVCRTSGQWSQPGSCEYDCGRPSTLTGESASYSYTYTNSVALYSCKAGYAMVGSGYSRTCNIGGWSDRQFECIVDCGMPPILINGASSYTTTTLNSVATYTCSSNYILVGSSTLTCTTSGWSTFTTSCIIDCGEPTATVANAALGSGSTVQGSSRFYTCNSGYRSSNAATSIVCQSNGQWSSPTFQCIDICPGGWMRDDTHRSCYYVYTYPQQYHDATSYCLTSGANLLSLQTVEKRDSFFAYLQNVFHHQSIYIGARTADPDSGTWYWPDGSYFTDQSPIWKHDEPRDDDECAFVHHEKEIKSTSCDVDMLFACEIAF